MSKLTVAVLGSHSALDVCRGAKDEGLNTLVVVEKGRDKTYSAYFKSQGDIGCVDEIIEVDKFKDVLSDSVQKRLKSKNSVFIPHRSFEVYVNDYDAIENNFDIPIFGNRKLLRYEERTEKPNQYDLLRESGIKYPKIFENPKDINTMVIVKVNESVRKFERAFFIVESYEQYLSKSQELIKGGIITREDLSSATIEEFILGVQVNFNFFNSPVSGRLELIGTDTRRQTDIEGILKLPAKNQADLR